MEISFETKPLREVCENEAAGNRQLGDTVATALRNRLADCDAASSVKELLAGKPRELDDGAMRIELESGSSLVFVANHPDIPLTSRGKIDWERVHSIRILRIESKDEPN